jgi:hypothetical protein
MAYVYDPLSGTYQDIPDLSGAPGYPADQTAYQQTGSDVTIPVMPTSGSGWAAAIGMVASAVALLPEELLASAIAAIATVTGYLATDLLTGFLKKKGSRHRRGRGISGRQLKTTGQTLRKLHSINRTVAKYCRTAAPHCAPRLRVVGHHGRK